ncbi:MAG: hypothetical protein AAB757_02235, partial [Patescibacteria group bacterium]
MHIPEQKLKTMMEKSGVVTEKDFESAKEEAFRSGQSILNILIGSGAITEDYLTELLESQYNIPVVDLKKVVIPLEILELIPEAFAKSKSAV